MSLFDFWDAKEGATFEEGWINKLIWGDNLLVIGLLIVKFAGKINMDDEVLPGMNKVPEEMAQEIRFAAVVK
jgi:adenine specific DNA methylase Mod